MAITGHDLATYSVPTYLGDIKLAQMLHERPVGTSFRYARAECSPLSAGPAAAEGLPRASRADPIVPRAAAPAARACAAGHCNVRSPLSASAAVSRGATNFRAPPRHCDISRYYALAGLHAREFPRTRNSRTPSSYKYLLRNFGGYISLLDICRELTMQRQADGHRMLWASARASATGARASRAEDAAGHWPISSSTAGEGSCTRLR